MAHLSRAEQRRIEEHRKHKLRKQERHPRPYRRDRNEVDEYIRELNRDYDRGVV